MRRFRVTVGPDSLDICAWGLSWRAAPHSAHLDWNQVKGIHLQEQNHPIAARGSVRVFLIETDVGPFALSSLEWPDPERFAEAISERIGQPLGQLPPDVQLAVNSRRDAGGRSFPVRAMRFAGRCFIVLGWVLLALIILGIFVAPGEDRLSVAKALLFIPIIFVGARAMCRFRAL